MLCQIIFDLVEKAGQLFAGLCELGAQGKGAADIGFAGLGIDAGQEQFIGKIGGEADAVDHGIVDEISGIGFIELFSVLGPEADRTFIDCEKPAAGKRKRYNPL